jgi:hypothetical protein
MSIALKLEKFRPKSFSQLAMLPAPAMLLRSSGRCNADGCDDFSFCFAMGIRLSPVAALVQASNVAAR